RPSAWSPTCPSGLSRRRTSRRRRPGCPPAPGRRQRLASHVLPACWFPFVLQGTEPKRPAALLLIRSSYEYRPPNGRALALRVGRHLRQLPLLGLQLLEHHPDGAVELLVLAGVLPGRVVVHHDVGIDAVALDDPLLALDVEARELRPVQVAAVQQRQRATDADDAAPAP